MVLASWIPLMVAAQNGYVEVGGALGDQRCERH